MFSNEPAARPAVSARCFSRTGHRHRLEGIDCQDAHLMLETEEFGFYGLADGQSGQRYCRIGAEAVLKFTWQFIEQRTLQALLRHPYTDELQYELIRTIRACLAGLSRKYNAVPAEFASTLVAVALDRSTGEYLTIHLGDGAILGVSRDKGTVLLSAPENGITRQYTWLTSSRDAMRHLRLQRNSAAGLDRLVLLTDGATLFCRGGLVSHRGDLLFRTPDNPSDIEQALCSSDPQDDASCLVVDFSPVFSIKSNS